MRHDRTTINGAVGALEVAIEGVAAPRALAAYQAALRAAKLPLGPNADSTAAAVVQAWADKGYLIIYVTGRPYPLRAGHRRHRPGLRPARA